VLFDFLSLTSLWFTAVPRSDLTAWLTKEMREQQIVNEAAGGDPLAESAVGPPEPHKPLQDYFPILADDDVRQKGRNKQKVMITNRAQKNVEAASQAASEAPVCELRFSRRLMSLLFY
jgi:translation initiation factor 2-alpha kinase 4